MHQEDLEQVAQRKCLPDPVDDVQEKGLPVARQKRQQQGQAMARGKWSR